MSVSKYVCIHRKIFKIVSITRIYTRTQHSLHGFRVVAYLRGWCSMSRHPRREMNNSYALQKRCNKVQFLVHIPRTISTRFSFLFTIKTKFPKRPIQIIGFWKLVISNTSNQYSDEPLVAHRWSPHCKKNNKQTGSKRSLENTALPDLHCTKVIAS